MDIKRHNPDEEYESDRLTDPEDLLNEIQLDKFILDQWYEKGYLSFKFSEKKTLVEENLCEIYFIQNLFSYYKSEELISEMLKELEKPYLYSFYEIFYSIYFRKWMNILQEDRSNTEEKSKNNLIELINETDHFLLKSFYPDIKKSIENCDKLIADRNTDNLLREFDDFLNKYSDSFIDGMFSLKKSQDIYKTIGDYILFLFDIPIVCFFITDHILPKKSGITDRYVKITDSKMHEIPYESGKNIRYPIFYDGFSYILMNNTIIRTDLYFDDSETLFKFIFNGNYSFKREVLVYSTNQFIAFGGECIYQNGEDYGRDPDHTKCSHFKMLPRKRSGHYEIHNFFGKVFIFERDFINERSYYNYNFKRGYSGEKAEIIWKTCEEKLDTGKMKNIDISFGCNFE